MIRRLNRPAPTQRPRILIVVQNLPVPFDRRVWLECQALRDAGYSVSVVCPAGPDDPAYEELDGVHLYKYRPYSPGGSKLSFVAEYGYSLALTTLRTFSARRRGAFSVMQACNPPDIFWPLALLLRALDGTRFVFDHHDLCPELFESRFDGRPRAVYRMLRLNEWLTHRAADHVISTNESYREVAISRSGKRPEDVTVVRTGPDPHRLRRQEPDSSLRRGRRHLVGYIGVMGPQDGVDIAVRAADIVVNEMHRDDVSFTFIGGGDCHEDLVALRDGLGLQDVVEFTGRIPDDDVRAILSTADVGLSPDPKNPLNDVSTMNKTLEYMSFELPVVAFDLKETRVSADDAAVYVQPNDEHRYARAIVSLLDNPELRRQMGGSGRQRIVSQLGWVHQAERYIRVYDLLTGRAGQPRASVDVREPARDERAAV